MRDTAEHSQLLCTQVLERRLAFGAINDDVDALDARVSLELVGDGGWVCRASKTAVEVSPLVLEILWCLGYFQLGADTYWSQNAGVAGAETTAAINLTRVPALAREVALLDWVLHRWLNHKSSPWPCDAPSPSPKLEGRAGAATGIAAAAFGFIYRHELAHIYLGHHGCSAAPELEIEADRQSIEWAIDGLPEGSEQHDVVMLGVGLGLETIAIAELWSRPRPAVRTHPPAHSRLNLLDGYLGDENHRVWKQMALGLPIHVQTAGEKFDGRVYQSFRECAQECIDILSRRHQRRSRG